MAEFTLGKSGQDKKPAGGFFSHKKEETTGAPPGFADVVAEVNNTSRRLRILEDRYGNIRDKMQFLEQNQLTVSKTIITELRATERDLLEIKRAMKELDNKIIQLGHEVTSTAKREEVLVLKRYIELWQPLNFVTRNQVEKIVAEIVEEKLQSLKP